jgi:hypothetical protein
MIGTIASTILALIAQIAPYATAATTVAKVIAILEALIPAVVNEARDLYPTFKHVISLLRGNKEVTSQQLDELDAIETKADADFDPALAKAKAEDAAADGLPAASGGSGSS